jgi:hypothetical protein
MSSRICRGNGLCSLWNERGRWLAAVVMPRVEGRGAGKEGPARATSGVARRGHDFLGTSTQTSRAASESPWPHVWSLVDAASPTSATPFLYG